MSFRSIIARSLCAGVFAFAGSVTGSVHAGVVTQTFSLPLTQTNFNVGTSAFAGANPFNVQKFDTSLGTLTSVTLKMDYEFENTLTTRFANESTITVAAHGEISLSVPNVGSLSGSFDRTGSSSASASDSFPKSVNLGTNVYKDSKSASYVDSSTLSKFQGAGVIVIPAVATASSNFSSTSGNGFGGSRTLAAVNFLITYNFTPAVPEPGSVVLMGLGSLGLIAFARKRSQQLCKASQSRLNLVGLIERSISRSSPSMDCPEVVGLNWFKPLTWVGSPHLEIWQNSPHLGSAP